MNDKPTNEAAAEDTPEKTKAILDREKEERELEAAQSMSEENNKEPEPEN